MDYPLVHLSHLRRMTDSVGLFQHAIYTLPDPQKGYTLDDNARAFIVALHHHRRTGDAASLELARRYLAFIRYAQTPDGHFLNFLPFDRQWRGESGSPDASGRAIWALGYGVRHAPERGMRDASRYLLECALPHAARLNSPRAMAFALLGFGEARLAFDWAERFAAQLAALFDGNASEDWLWFEPYLTYSNAVLPQALLVASEWTGTPRYRDIAQRSLEFLIGVIFQRDMLDLVGEKGWYRRNGQPARFDQQPIDAACAVETLLVAQRALQEPRYGELAHRALEWFYGRNRGSIALYDPETGGCYDGLTPEGVNRNQGAESTVAHLRARLLIDDTACARESRHAAEALSR